MTASVDPIRPMTLEVYRLLKQQLNLALLGWAAISWTLTGDYTIPAFCLVIEIWYLSLGARGGPLSQLVDHVRSSRRFGLLRQLKWQALLSWLLLACGVLFIVVVRSERITVSGFFFENSYERWEVAALTWNAVFAAVSYVQMPLGDTPLSQKLVPFIRIFGGGFCTWRALGSLAQGDHIWHLFYVLLIAVCYLLVDLVICWACPPERRRCTETALYCDLPTAIALLALLVYSKGNAGSENMNIFLSGAISFQFIASSLVLALIEGRVPEVLSCWSEAVGSAGAAASVRVGA